MKDDRPRVYCSGSLFNDKEREEMLEIADALERAGFSTFLPQRDGFEFKPLLPALIGMGIEPERATELWDKAIFALDAFQAAIGCRAMIVNLNGRVPDEGAVAEAALAWSCGNIVVGYKADVRSLLAGRDNAMVSGLFGFRTCGSIGSAVESVAQSLRNTSPLTRRADEIGGAIRDALALGKRLSEAPEAGDDLDAAVRLLL